MNSNLLLTQLQEALEKGDVKKSDIQRLLTNAAGEGKSAMTSSTITTLLYALGGLVVATGLVIFISQIWEDIGSLGRILVTLGVGLSCMFAGSVVFVQNVYKENSFMLGSILHTLGCMLVPGGIFVLLYEQGIEPSSWAVALIFALLATLYGMLMLAQRQVILTLATLVFATVTSYAVLYAALEDVDTYNTALEDMWMYLTMVWGASYVMLGKQFEGTWNALLVRALYFFGIVGFLGAAFSQVVDGGVWEVLYIPLLAGSIFVAIYIRSTSVLMVSTGFLVAYIAYITGQYFADSIGWPLALVFIGLVLMGCGYASVVVNKKYIQR